MPLFEVTGPDGTKYEVTGPRGATQQDAIDQVRAKLAGQDIKKSYPVASGTAPVKPSVDLGEALKNTPESAKNLAVGTITTAKDAAVALMNPDPRAKLDFITNMAKGIYQHVKEYHDNGLAGQFNKDPVGVIADALSLALGVRGVRSSGGVEVPTSAASRAIAIVNRDMASDVASQTATGVGPTPMDRGGTAIANQVERLSNTSAGGREILEPFLTQRQKNSFGRITGELATLSESSRTARQALDETVKSQSAAASPLYNEAYSSGDRPLTVSDDVLTPAVESAMRSAVSQWKDNFGASGYGSMNVRTGPAGIKVGDITVIPNLQFWDYTKGALDSMIDEHKNTITGRLDRRGTTLNTLKNKLVAQLDAQVPEYAKARQAWAGPASYLSALEMGSDIFSKSADNFVADFNKLSAADKQAVRESSVTKIVSDLAKSSSPIGTDLRDLTSKLKNREMIRKVLAILPDNQARQAWVQRLRQEVRSSQVVGQGLKNSATAKRQAMAAEASSLIDDMVLGAVKAAVESGGATAKLRLIVGGWKKIRDKIQASTDREMAKIMTGQKTSTKIQKPVFNRSPLLAPALTSQQQQ